MPQVTAPSGETMNVPTNLSGQDLSQQFKLPDNRILLRRQSNGGDEVIKREDNVAVQEGDQFDTMTSFERGLM